MKECIVVLIGNVRGSEAAWTTLYKHVIGPLNADLACLFGEAATNKETSLYQKAKYFWETPELGDWGLIFDRTRHKVDWRKTAKRTAYEGLWGGTVIDGQPQIGSGAIIFAFRHILLQYSSILSRYKQVILTRSDHYYFRDHPKLNVEDVWIPDGEDYNGITDRHHIFPATRLKETLSVVDWMLLHLQTIERAHTHNPEHILLLYFCDIGITPKRFERVMCTVKTRTDSTRWSEGCQKLLENRNLYVKYKDEYDLARKKI